MAMAMAIKTWKHVKCVFSLYIYIRIRLSKVEQEHWGSGCLTGLMGTHLHLPGLSRIDSISLGHCAGSCFQKVLLEWVCDLWQNRSASSFIWDQCNKGFMFHKWSSSPPNHPPDPTQPKIACGRSFETGVCVFKMNPPPKQLKCPRSYLHLVVK